jgi:hypothetical protein
MIRTQVSLDAQLYEEAKAEAKRRGISFAELCRRALARAIRQRGGEKPWMRFAGALQSGDPDASRTVDEVVYVRERP